MIESYDLKTRYQLIFKIQVHVVLHCQLSVTRVEAGFHKRQSQSRSCKCSHKSAYTLVKTKNWTSKQHALDFSSQNNCMRHS